MNTLRSRTLVLAVLATAACADEPTSAPEHFTPELSQAVESHAIAAEAIDGAEIEAFFVNEMATANARLEAEGSNMRVVVAELLLAPGAPVDIGTTIYANNRTQQLSYIWVQGDPRRGGSDALTYMVDESHAYAFTRTDYPATTYMGAHFDASFAPWTALQCSKLDLVRVPDNGTDPSFYDYPAIDDGATVYGQADIVEAGWRTLPAGVLGTSYTWVFVDDNGKPTDINNDGRRDTSRNEIWYARGYYWTTNAVPGIDFLSVAIHENGHSIGLGHFGQIFRTNANGELHFSPRAIMNAAYVSRMQDLLGTDESAYCTNYASWE